MRSRIERTRVEFYGMKDILLNIYRFTGRIQKYFDFQKETSTLSCFITAVPRDISDFVDSILH